MRRDPQEMMLFLGPLLLAVLMLVVGCTPESARWTPTEAPKENKVEFVTLAHQVHFAPGAVTTTSAEAKALSDFLGGIALGYGDQVTIDPGTRSGSVAVDTLASKRLDAVTAMLRKLHVRAQSATRPSVDGALAQNVLVVTVGRYIVTGPNCPDRRKPESDDFSNTTQSNYGCATATNLGLMVANPGDLVRGIPAGPADGEFSTRGVQNYRSGAMSKSIKSEMGSSGGGGN
jgi:pilus assembly protein CpaD